MAHTKATMKRRAVVGIKTIPQPPQPQPGRKTRMKTIPQPPQPQPGKKTGIKPIPQPPQLQPRRKTTWVGKTKKEIPARYKSIMGDMEVSKVNRTVNPQNGISKVSERVFTVGIYLAQDPGGCCLGPSQGCQSLSHPIIQEHKLVHNTHHVCPLFCLKICSWLGESRSRCWDKLY